MIRFLPILTLAISCSLAQAMSVTDFDLSDFDEDKFIGKNKEAKLLALTDENQPYSSHKEPLILVHGINGSPADMQGIVERFKSSNYQIYILAYSDFKRRGSLNALDMLKELLLLSKSLGKNRDLTIIAHSMGGLISKSALNHLASGNKESFNSIELFTIDTPWHGFSGPADSDAGGVPIKVVGWFMPDGLEDMRAKSDFMKQIYNYVLPAHISVDVVFAQDGDQALDYTEENMAQLAALILQDMKGEKKNKLQQLQNLLNALKFSKRYPEFIDSLETIKASGNLSLEEVNQQLKVYFPKFNGDHLSVIFEQAENSYLDYLETKLLP